MQLADTLTHSTTAMRLHWTADTEPLLRPFEVERIIRASIDVTTAVWSIVRLLDLDARPGSSRPQMRLSGQFQSRSGLANWYTDTRNDELRVARISYENPLVVDVALVEATSAALTAAAAIATMLITGAAMRRKLIAEARKLNADAARAEFDLRVLADGGVLRDEDVQPSLIPPDADGTWPDVILITGGLGNGAEVRSLTLAYKENTGLSAQIELLRKRNFTVSPED